MYTNINQEREQLSDLAGCSWEEVEEWFSGMTIEQIEAEANRCWPHDDNRKFAERVHEAL